MAPKDAYFAGHKPATLRYLFRSIGERRDLVIKVVRASSRRTVARWLRPDSVPGRVHERRWRGVDRRGRPVRAGLYAFRLRSPGFPGVSGGRFRLHGHRFPVAGRHGTRGPIGDFGAPRSGGRTHEGFDVTAACGTRLLAARAGRVVRSGYDPRLYGNFVEVSARKSRLSYFYAHMARPATARRGDVVRTSRPLGRIGQTGNAAGTPCHLHVELRRSGRLIDPEPRLRRWDRRG